MGINKGGEPGFYRITIYRKIILIFLIAVVPVFMLSLYLNKTGEKKVNDEVSKVLSSKAEFCLGSIEKEADRMLTFIQYYAINDRFLDLSNRYEVLDSYEKSYAVRKMNDDFSRFLYTTNYMDHIYLYLKKINRVISSETYTYYEPDENVTAKIKDYYQYEQRYGNFISTGNGLAIAQIFGSPSEEAASLPSIMLFSEFSEDKLNMALNDYFGGDHMGAVIYNSDFSWHVHNRDGEMVQILLNNLRKKTSNTGNSSINFMNINGKEYLLIEKSSIMLNISLITYIEKEYFSGYTSWYQIWFWALLCFAGIIIAIFSFWLFRLVYKPFHRLISSFGVIEEGVIDIVLKEDRNDEFKYLYSRINTLVRKYKELVNNYYEEKYRSQQNELKFLQSQIKPHFFYNSLYVLQNLLMLNDIDGGIKLAKYLSSYYKFITRSSSDFTALHDEIEHARNFSGIQEFRFMGRITVKYGMLPEEYGKMEVPRLIIQPVVENCFKHGLSEKVSGGLISVDFSCNGDNVIITVEDNGKGFEESRIEYFHEVFSGKREPDKITALININRRLVLRYGPESGLRIHNHQGGSRVEILIMVGQEAEKCTDC